MMKIRTLRPVLTKLKMITPNMYLSQVPTPKLHVNLSHNHQIMESDTSSTLHINNPTAENIPKKESNSSRGGKYNLRPNPNLNYSEIYRYFMCAKLYSSPFLRVNLLPISALHFLHTHHLLLFFLSFWGTYKITKNDNKAKFTQNRNNSKLINNYNSFN